MATNRIGLFDDSARWRDRTGATGARIAQHADGKIASEENSACAVIRFPK